MCECASRRFDDAEQHSPRAVRAGLESDPHHGSVVPPIYLSSNFAFQGYRQPRKYDYTRSGNPTRDQLALALADLEGLALPPQAVRAALPEIFDERVKPPMNLSFILSVDERRAP